ncbi:MAG TPA: hypothetical protein VM598_14865 [Bdellovibrionota bacterium]|nr:hypothetical protein [Bdellovibrionota bacterium]
MKTFRSLGRVAAPVLFAMQLSSAQARTDLVPDHPATGWIDLADDTAIAGWAKDPDFDGPVSVQIYVDGLLAATVIADRERSDVGKHAFHWKHKGFGAGRHKVMAWVVGITAGNTPANVSPLFPGPGKPIAFMGNNKHDPVAIEISSEDIPQTVDFPASPATASASAPAPAPAPADPKLTLQWR